MRTTIQIDRSGRLVLPKAIRQRLNLSAGAHLRAGVVAGHIELTPVADDAATALRPKSSIKVLGATGAKVGAATAVAAERDAQESRSRRAIYDDLHLVAAKRASASHVSTLNVRHFSALAQAGQAAPSYFAAFASNAAT